MRFQVIFNKKQTAALNKLANELETTKAGVLRTALALFEAVIRERKTGNIGIVKGRTVIKEIVGIY